MTFNAGVWLKTQNIAFPLKSHEWTDETILLSEYVNFSAKRIEVRPYFFRRRNFVKEKRSLSPHGNF